MAADIHQITEGNHDEMQCYLQHILDDLHTALEKLERIGALTEQHDRLLTEFRPLLDQFRSPAAAYVATRKLRRNGNG